MGIGDEELLNSDPIGWWKATGLAILWVAGGFITFLLLVEFLIVILQNMRARLPLDIWWPLVGVTWGTFTCAKLIHNSWRVPLMMIVVGFVAGCSLLVAADIALRGLEIR